VRLGNAFLVVTWLAQPAAAWDLDPTLYRRGDTYLTPTLELQAGYWLQGNAWGGQSEEILGDEVDDWMEFSAQPGLEGALSLAGRGLLYARVSGVGSWTRLGLDAAGSNESSRDAGRWTLEDAYVGWCSGDLFPALGQDAVDLSVGAQDYRLGTGFLLWDGGTDGGVRGGYWTSARTAFSQTAIARLHSGPWRGELLWLVPNDEPDTHTRLVGTNLERRFGKLAAAGFTWLRFYASDNPRRDGLDVFDLRAELAPLDGLRLSGELAREKNGRLNDSWGGYAEAAYALEGCPWKPQASYRFSYFSGDEPSRDRIEAFDPLYQGFSDWGTWYQGEIFGEYAGANRNLVVHAVRLRAEPSESLTLTLLYFHFRAAELASELVSRLVPRAGNVSDRHLGDEVDLAADLEVNEHLALAAVVAVFVPGAGGRGQPHPRGRPAHPFPFDRPSSRRAAWSALRFAGSTTG
jgi:Alginate export